MDSNGQNGQNYVSLRSMADRCGTTPKAIREFLTNYDLPYVRTANGNWAIPVGYTGRLQGLANERKERIHSARLAQVVKARAAFKRNPALRTRKSTRAIEAVSAQLKEQNDRLQRIESLLVRTFA